MLKEGITILYKDQKGGLSLYDVLQKESAGNYFVQQLKKYNRESMKFPKKFSTTPRDKSGKYRLFPLWLEFEKDYYILRNGVSRYVVLQSYIYMDNGLSFDFYEKSTGKLITLSFDECCKFVHFIN